MTQQLETEIYYPESDGQPMGETDAHRDILVYLVTALQQYFANRPDVYVTGNLFIYYVRGQPRLSVCPDVFVAFGSAKRRRETYQTWRDGPFPQVVIEVSSPSTRTDDEVRKPRLYEEQGVLEYYLFDPHREPEAPDAATEVGELKRYWRSTVEVPFGPVETIAPGTLVHSDALGLGLTARGRELRLVNEATGRLLPTADEEVAARQAAEEQALVEAQARRAEEQARQAAEAQATALADEVARLRAELEKYSEH